MRKNFKVIGIILIAFVLPSHALSHVHSMQELASQAEIEKNVLKLGSPEISEKYAASEYLLKLSREELGPAVLSKATALFFREIEEVRRFRELIKKPGNIYDKVPKDLLYINKPEWQMYFMNLRDIAAKSRDEKLLPELIEFEASPKEMLSYGESVIDPILSLFNKAEPQGDFVDPGPRRYAVQVLIHLIKEKEKGFVARGAAKEKIMNALVDCVLTDQNNPLRGFIVDSFGDLGDDEFIPVLENLAQNDKWNYEAVADPGFDEDSPPGQKINRYPVRMAARKALEKIKKK